MKKFYILKKVANKVIGVEVLKESGLFNVSHPKEFSIKDWRGRRSIIIDNTEPIYFAKENFTKGPREVLLFQISEKLQPLAIFSGTPYIVFKSLDETTTEVELIYLAVDKKNTKNNLEFFLRHEARVEAQYHFMCCIGSLSLKLSSSNVLSLYLSDHDFWILITDGTDIVYIRKYPLDEFTGLTESQVEEGVLTTIDYYHRFTNRPIEAFIAYGPRKNLAPSLGGLKRLESSWTLFRGVDPEVILQWPEFYGALFVAPEFNLIPENHRLWLNNLKFGRLVACIFLAFSFVNYGAWYYFSNQNDTLKSTIAYKERILTSKIQELKKEFSQQRIDQLKKYLDIVQAFHNQPRVDDLLVWLANIIPEGVKITKLSIKSLSQDSLSQNSRKASSTVIQSDQLSIFLKLQMRASAQETQKAFYRMFQALSTKMIFRNSRLVYDEGQKVGFFYFELMPKKDRNL